MEYRLFISIDPPEIIRKEMEKIYRNLQKVRWSPDSQLHLTLRFIGRGDELLIRDLVDVLDSIDFDPFTLQIRGTGHFPLRGKPQILWAGLEPSDQLIRLYKDIENALVQCGIKREGRRFHPHITLGRLKGESVHSVGEWLTATSTFRSSPFPVNSFHLYNSRLNPDGAIHEKLVSF